MPQRTNTADPIESAIKNVLINQHLNDGLDVLEPLQNNTHAQGAVHAALRNYIRTVVDLRIQVPTSDSDYNHTRVSVSLEQRASHLSLGSAFRALTATLERVLSMPQKQANDVAETLLLQIGKEWDDQQRQALGFLAR